MYYVQRTVGFSEIGPDYMIKLTKILDYFQDVCIEQSEKMGVGAYELGKRGMCWVLSSWQVVIERYPKLGETVIVGTAPYEFKGFLGSRNFILKTPEGEILAYANSIWSFIDTEKLTLIRVPEDVINAYTIDEKYDMEYAPRKIKLPQNMEEAPPFDVMYHNLDSNAHVNNAQYISMAEDLVEEGRRTGQMRAEYRVSARMGDVIKPFISRDDEQGLVTVSLADKEGKPFVLVEFKK